MPWSYAIDDDENESWQGSCATKEDAIAEAISELADEISERVRDLPEKEYARQPHFFVGYGEPMDPAQAFADADELIERAREYVYDNTNCEDDDTIELAADAEQKLVELLAAWARVNVKIRCWTIEKVERVNFPIEKLAEEPSDP